MAADDDKRRDDILIRMLRTPPQPHAIKPKGRAKPTKRTTGKGRVRVGKGRS